MGELLSWGTADRLANCIVQTSESGILYNEALPLTGSLWEAFFCHQIRGLGQMSIIIVSIRRASNKILGILKFCRKKICLKCRLQDIVV